MSSTPSTVTRCGNAVCVTPVLGLHSNTQTQGNCECPSTRGGEMSYFLQTRCLPAARLRRKAGSPSSSWVLTDITHRLLRITRIFNRILMVAASK